MVLRTRLIAGSAAVMLGSLLLAGCSSTGSEPSAAPTTSNAPSAMPDVTIAPPEENTGRVPGGSGEVPAIEDTVISTEISGDDLNEVTVYSGDASNIAVLEEGFAANGFIWNNINGDNSYVIASSVKQNATLIDNGDGTYSITLFRGE